jgi:hypothetical protein
MTTHSYGPFVLPGEIRVDPPTFLHNLSWSPLPDSSSKLPAAINGIFRQDGNREDANSIYGRRLL